jgi:hypothetical protein
MKPGLRTAIEQAIARGWTTTRLMHDLAVPYSVVRAVRDGMSETPEPDRPDVSERRIMIGGRPLSSYYGPAHPSVIEELVNAICPPTSRRRKEAA